MAYSENQKQVRGFIFPKLVGKWVWVKNEQQVMKLNVAQIPKTSEEDNGRIVTLLCLAQQPTTVGLYIY